MCMAPPPRHGREGKLRLRHWTIAHPSAVNPPAKEAASSACGSLGRVGESPCVCVCVALAGSQPSDHRPCTRVSGLPLLCTLCENDARGSCVVKLVARPALPFDDAYEINTYKLRHSYHLQYMYRQYCECAYAAQGAHQPSRGSGNISDTRGPGPLTAQCTKYVIPRRWTTGSRSARSSPGSCLAWLTVFSGLTSPGTS